MFLFISFSFFLYLSVNVVSLDIYKVNNKLVLNSTQSGAIVELGIFGDSNYNSDNPSDDTSAFGFYLSFLSNPLLKVHFQVNAIFEVDGITWDTISFYNLNIAFCKPIKVVCDSIPILLNESIHGASSCIVTISTIDNVTNISEFLQ